MSTKNLVRRLGVHDKTNHTLEVRSLSLGEIIGRSVRITLFCKNASIIWDQHKLEGTFKLSVFTHKANTLKSLSSLSLLIQVQPRKHFNMQILSMNYTNHTTLQPFAK